MHPRGGLAPRWGTCMRPCGACTALGLRCGSHGQRRQAGRRVGQAAGAERRGRAHTRRCVNGARTCIFCARQPPLHTHARVRLLQARRGRRCLRRPGPGPPRGSTLLKSTLSSRPLSTAWRRVRGPQYLPEVQQGGAGWGGGGAVEWHDKACRPGRLRVQSPCVPSLPCCAAG